MTCWLVEMNHNDAPIPRWWSCSPHKGWVWDANEATRFCREVDAKDFVAGQRFLSGKPTEHVFLPPAASPTAPVSEGSTHVAVEARDGEGSAPHALPGVV